MHLPGRSVKQSPHFRNGSVSLTAAAELFSIRNEAKDVLSNFSLDQSLRVDPRPTFVVDLDSTSPATTKDSRDQLRIAYCNPALAEQSALLDDISGNFAEKLKIVSSYAAFRRWVVDRNHSDSAPFMFKEFLWIACTIQDKAHSYRIISGTTLTSLWSDQSSEKSESLVTDKSQDDYVLGLERVSSLDPATLFKHEDANWHLINHDWTQLEPPAKLSNHIKFARGVDWTNTPLGPMETWGTELRVAANLVMADVHAAVVFWGPEGILIYNETYAKLIEGIHPCIGESVFTALKDYTDHVSFGFVLKETRNQRLYMVRLGFSWYKQV